MADAPTTTDDGADICPSSFSAMDENFNFKWRQQQQQVLPLPVNHPSNPSSSSSSRSPMASNFALRPPPTSRHSAPSPMSVKSFKLRPRSNSLGACGVSSFPAGIGIGTTTMPPPPNRSVLQQQQQQRQRHRVHNDDDRAESSHTVSPDGPIMHPAPDRGCRKDEDGSSMMMMMMSCEMMPPTSFAPFFTSRTTSRSMSMSSGRAADTSPASTSASSPCSSPVKKQKTRFGPHAPQAQDHDGSDDDDDDDGNESRGETFGDFLNLKPDAPRSPAAMADAAAPPPPPPGPPLSFPLLPSPAAAFPSTPTRESSSSSRPSPRSGGKRPLSRGAVDNGNGNGNGPDLRDSTTTAAAAVASPYASSPFTPSGGLRMMQDLRITGGHNGDNGNNGSSSPSPPPSTISSANTAFVVGGGGGGSSGIATAASSSCRTHPPPLLIHQQLPAVPTFSFSPSLHQNRYYGGPRAAALAAVTAGGAPRQDYKEYNNSRSDAVQAAVMDSSPSSSALPRTPHATPKKNGAPLCHHHHHHHHPPPQGCSSVAGSSVGGDSSRATTTDGSPFRSASRTPIGRRSGSVFKTLPPRGGGSGGGGSGQQAGALWPSHQQQQQQPEGASSGTSSPVMTAIQSPAPPFSATPSPRLVPLTVLSRGGSPLPMDPSSHSAMAAAAMALSSSSGPSPLMRSLDRIAKEDHATEEEEEGNRQRSTMRTRTTTGIRDDQDQEQPQDSVKMPSILSGGGGGVLLPRIRLTPRGKDGSSFLAAKLDRPPPRLDLSQRPYDDGDIVAPRLAQRNRRTTTRDRSSSLSTAGETYGPSEDSVPTDGATQHLGGEAAAEMDSLLHGFDRRRGAADGASEGGDEEPPGIPSAGSSDSGPCLSRVESEEAEMVELTSRSSWQVPAPWLPPVRERESDNHIGGGGGGGGRSTPTSPDDPVRRKPMPSIAFPSSADRRPRSLSLHGHEDPRHHRHVDVAARSPRFLPRPAPASSSARPRSRSLFDGSGARADPLERILRADAIAEAARSDEPLTDEDTDEDDGNTGFMLFPPGVGAKGRYEMSTSNGTGAGRRSSGARSESPTPSAPTIKSRCAGANFPRRSKGAASPLLCAPTILEEGLATTTDEGDATPGGPSCDRPTSFPEGGGGLHQGLNKRETSDATFSTFCSLSDCDFSDIMASPKYSRGDGRAQTRSGSSSFHKDRPSACSMLSVSSSLCGLDIVHESSMGIEVANGNHNGGGATTASSSATTSFGFGADRFPPLGRSDSSDTAPPRGEQSHGVAAAGMFRPLRSELSLNSLGLSVDSLDALVAGVPGDADARLARDAALKRSVSPRDLFTPPVGAQDARASGRMLSPPPLKCRESSPIPFNSYSRWG